MKLKSTAIKSPLFKFGTRLSRCNMHKRIESFRAKRFILRFKKEPTNDNETTIGKSGAQQLARFSLTRQVN